MKRKNLIKNILMIAGLGLAIMFFTNVIFAASTAKISVETANLRQTADENSKILEQLSLNDEVEVLQKTNNWYQVKTKDNITGYLREDLVEVSGEVKEENTTNQPSNESEENVQQEEQKEEATEETGTRVVKEDTKLKIVPVINATDIIEVKQNDEVTVIETIGEWICIEKDTTKGWIRSEKLMTLEEKAKQDEEAKAKEEAEKKAQEEAKKAQEQTVKTMYANSTTVNVRETASKESKIVAQISQNTAVEVLSEEGGWYKVKTNGKEGYVATNLLSSKKTEVETTSRGSTTTRKSNKEEVKTTVPASGKGATVVETAKNYIGYRYVYGAAGPNSFDCSGFTSYVFKLHGVSLSRTAKAQYSNGSPVASADLQPGDLVMFGHSVS